MSKRLKDPELKSSPVKAQKVVTEMQNGAQEGQCCARSASQRDKQARRIVFSS